ncbi:MAG: MerR family transcriptional regulator [Chloroflexi bacterium]|nr:MerR family transcriptional regulator [Chloroflexota bacterium]
MGPQRTIEQAARETGLTTDTLRYYERIGLITDVARAPNGHRRYDDDDIVWILFLKQLRATGMPIAQMRRFAQLRREGDATVPQRRAMLEQHRQNLQEQVQSITAFMAVIDAKISRHKQHELRMRRKQADERTPDPMA